MSTFTKFAGSALAAGMMLTVASAPSFANPCTTTAVIAAPVQTVQYVQPAVVPVQQVIYSAPVYSPVVTTVPIEVTRPVVRTVASPVTGQIVQVVY